MNHGIQKILTKIDEILSLIMPVNILQKKQFKKKNNTNKFWKLSIVAGRTTNTAKMFNFIYL